MMLMIFIVDVDNVALTWYERQDLAKQAEDAGGGPSSLGEDEHIARNNAALGGLDRCDNPS
jgi:hypothetical protein